MADNKQSIIPPRRRFAARRSDLGLQRIKTSRQNLNSLVKLTLLPESNNPSIRYKPANYIYDFMLNYQWDMPMNFRNQQLQDSINRYIKNNSMLSSERGTESPGPSHSLRPQTSPVHRVTDSVLNSLPSIRLTQRYENTKHLTIAAYTHNLNPYDYICMDDLSGKCKNEKCPYQHKAKYLMNDVDKLVDLISYRPSIAKFKHDPELSQEENFVNCRNKLRIYAQNLINRNPNKSIDSIARKLVRWIRSKFEENHLIHLTRQLPKLSEFDRPSQSEQSALVIDDNYIRRLAAKIGFVPYQNFEFQLDYVMQDPEFLLRRSRITNFSEMNPETNLKSRFFAEDRPICTELENILDRYPGNIPLWLKLAYYHLIRDTSDKAESIDRALNVLSRGLESNPGDSDLWENYLIIFYSRIPRPGESQEYQLSSICERATKFCPTFRIFKLSISLCHPFKQKLSIALNLIKLLYSLDGNTDFEKARQSQQLVEAVLFIVRMFSNIGLVEKAMEIGFQAFGEPGSVISSGQIGTTSLATISFDVPNLTEKLISRDLVFVRLTLIHFKMFGRFPETRLYPSGYSTPKLISSFPMALSLPKRGLTLISNDDLKVFFREYPNSLDAIELWKVNQELWYSQNLSMFSAIEILLEYSEHSEDSRLCYGLARLHFYDGDFSSCSRQLARLAILQIQTCQDFSCHHERLNIAKNSPNASQLMDLFAEMLHLTKVAENRYQTGKNGPIGRSPLLWLSLIMCCKMNAVPKDRIEALYDQSISCCSIPMPNQLIGLRPLIFDYVKYLTESMEKEIHFARLLSTVRNLCLTLPDEDFQIHLIEQITRVIVNTKTQLIVLIEFCLSLNNNSALLRWSLRCGLDIGERSLIYEVLIYLLFETDYQLSMLDSWCWNIALALSIENADHLKTHQIFRLAISYDPYNMRLWKLMKSYERSVNHIDHIDIIDKTMNKKLQLKFV